MNNIILVGTIIGALLLLVLILITAGKFRRRRKLEHTNIQDFYQERKDWINLSEEKIKFQSAIKLAKVPPGARVLDVGCGRRAMKQFLPQSVSYVGSDLISEDPEIIEADASKHIPLPDDSFDFIFALEVMEHLYFPLGFLNEAHRLLKKEGKLVVSVPNPYHIKEIIWNLFKTPQRWGHIYSWTWQTMRELGLFAKFNLIKTAGTYFHPPIPAKGFLSRSLVCLFEKENKKEE